MEGIFLGMCSSPQIGWAMWYRNKVVVNSNEVIAQIKAASIGTLD